MKRTKLLFTIPNFDTAGSGKVVYDLVKHLDSSRFEIELACGSREGAFFKVVEALGVPIHIFETKTAYRPYHSLLFRIWKISRFYKKHQFDIIHSWQWSNDWTEALAARFVGVTWLYTKKAMGFKSKHWQIKSFLANYIITINDEMSGYFPNKKQQALIPLGIDTDYYSPVHFSKKETNTFDVITVANLVPVKGIEVLIKAIHLLADDAITLTVVGDYDHTYGRGLVALVNDLGMNSQVKFIGKLQDVRPYMSQADLYVIPTLDAGRKEGMPMALVEAMSMGVPVLGSDISGINFVLKDFTHLLFPASDSQVLANKIKHFMSLDLEERRRLGNSLRSYCEAHFSMQAFIQAHDLLYKKLVPTKDV